MKIINHLLFTDNGKQVTYHETPNKRGLLVPQYLIMHYTASTSAASTINWFLDKTAKVSAHLLIDTLGTITQFAPFNQVAWHAGQSTWKGLNGMNQYGIGIELVNGGRLSKRGSDWICPLTQRVIPKQEVIWARHKNESSASAWQAYSRAQLDTAKIVAASLTNYYHLKEVLGHDDIAPGRKADPGPAFPMTNIRDLWNKA